MMLGLGYAPCGRAAATLVPLPLLIAGACLAGFLLLGGNK